MVAGPEIRNQSVAITLMLWKPNWRCTQRACQLVKVSYFPGMQHGFHPSPANERSNTTLTFASFFWLLLWYKLKSKNRHTTRSWMTRYPKYVAHIRKSCFRLSVTTARRLDKKSLIRNRFSLSATVARSWLSAVAWGQFLRRSGHYARSYI